MLKCIIIEDEFPAREELKYFLKNNKHFHIEKEFEHSIDALKYIEAELNQIDVIFLDINMPELDGMSLGKIISRLNKNIHLVFITAYRNYAIEAFEINAFDYILKPYSEERIIKLLNNLTEKFENNKKKNSFDTTIISKLTVNLDSKMVVLSTNDILYIEADEKETHIFANMTMYTSKLKISQLENILPSINFFRSHRSYIVNMNKIIEVEPWFNGTYILKLKDCSFNIPVSRQKVKILKRILIIK